MERRLSAEEKRYRELFDFSLSPRCLTVSGGKVVEANTAFRRLFSPKGDGISIKDFFSSLSDWDSLKGSFTSEGAIQGREFDMKNSKGEGLRILASVSGFDDPRYGSLLSWEFFDLTEGQRLKEELMQSQKMDALGKLAGGIAHDFNNILTTIVGHSEMLRMDLATGAAGNKDLQGISAAAARATRLTRQLLGFSRKQPYKPRIVDLAQLFRESESMLKKLAGETVLFSLQLPAQALPVFIDPIQIEQALMNLVANARDALQGISSGSIAVFALPQELQRGISLRGKELSPGKYAVISVADSGCGIPAELSERIFDPFFTTKGIHKGTGLGLAIVNSVISAGGGGVELISREGEGSEFRLWLPLADVSPKGAENSGRNPLEGADTIGVDKPGEYDWSALSREESLELPKGLSLLIVDDDEDLLGFLAYIAGKAGAITRTARNGGEALLLEEKHAFDAMVIDLNLPGLDGFALYERLAQGSSGPGLPCVFISGRVDGLEKDSSETDLSIEGKEPLHIPAGTTLLEKPFTPAKLIGALKKSLVSGKDFSV